MDELRVTPEDLDDLKTELDKALKQINAGFDAPEKIGGYPKKLLTSHGVTSFLGCFPMLDALSDSREVVHTRLTAVIGDLKAKLDAAKAAYQKTDESYADVIKQQVDTSD